MEVVYIKCSDVQSDFYYDEKGILQSWYDPKKEIVVELEDFDSEDDNDFDDESNEDKALINKIIRDGELYLPIHERFNLYAGYNAIRDLFYKKDHNLESPREIVDKIILRARLIANREKDLPNYLREQHSKYLELFEQCSQAERVLTSTINELTSVVFNNALVPDLPFGYSLEEIRRRPYDFTCCPDVWTWGSFWSAVDKHTLIDEYVKALSYLSVVRWLQTGIWYSECSDLKKLIEMFRASKKVDDTLPLKRLSQSQRALYYAYVHETRSEPAFGSVNGVEADIKKITDAYKCSFKSFQMAYNRLSKKKSERMGSSNLSNIESILPVLKKYPKAYELAFEEFKIGSRR